jgi:nucleotide-binding universal stress UspA family protein
MAYRKILIPFAGSDRNAGVPSSALALARKFDCYCEVLFIRPEPAQALPYLEDASPGIVMREIVDSANQAVDAASTTLMAAFDQAAMDANVEIVDGKPTAEQVCTKFIEIEGDTIEVAVRRSRLADLVIFVVGEAQAQVGISAVLMAVLMRSARPVLIIPRTEYVGDVGHKISIAWDGSSESANAVRSALPFLHAAASVKILNVQESIEEQGVRTDITHALGDYLGLHSITSAETIIDPRGKSIGSTILEQATQDGTDLLIMGAYGHSRVRELILGGVTQYLLEHTTIPTLMAH